MVRKFELESFRARYRVFPWVNKANKFLFSAAIAIVACFLLSSTASAIVVETANRTLNGGTADFGSGTHSFGGPSGAGVITFDYNTSSGQVVALGRVRGTLYWDALVSGGCARLTIRFRDRFNNTLVSRQVNHCGPGGDANRSANQAAVDESFSSSLLDNIFISANEVVNGVLQSGATTTALAPTNRSYLELINNGPTDFGRGAHVLGSPMLGGYIEFVRFEGTMTGHVRGLLFWDTLKGAGCARMIIDYRNRSETVLDSIILNKCGIGGPAASLENSRDIENSFTDSALFQIRLRVGQAIDGLLHNEVSRLFNFNGLVGNFELEPVDATVTVGEPLDYAFSWTVPEPLSWRSLDSLQLRISDDSDTVLWLRFDEASNSFSLFNQAAGRFGRAFAAGSPVQLQSAQATLNLRDTQVTVIDNALGSGPTSPSVRLNLSLSFKPSAAGRTFRVEVAASDDQGNQDPFTAAGTLTVTP